MLQLEVVQLGLFVTLIRADEHAARDAVGNCALQGGLEARAASKDGDS